MSRADKDKTMPTERSCKDHAGKYLTFKLGEEVYGIEILRVHEIIGMMKVTPIPNTPMDVRGVINLRGKVIAVIDLRAKFGLEQQEDTERTCIAVLQVGNCSTKYIIGVVVDSVCEVLDIDAANIEPAPSFGKHVNTDFIIGLAKTDDGVVTLLDINSVLSASDVEIAGNFDMECDAGIAL